MNLSAAASRWLRNGVWQRRALMLMTAAIAATYVVGVVATNRGSLVKGDGRSYFAFLPSLVLDRDVDLRNQFSVLKPEGDTEYPFGIGRNGVAETPFPISPALLWLPGYTAGLAIDRILGRLISEPQPLGYGIGSVLGAAVWSILLAGLGVDLTRRLVRDAVGPDEALPAAVMAWVATSALYYTVVSPLYSHAPAWFAVSLMLWSTWQAAHQPNRIAWWIASGFGAGLIVAVRLQDAALLTVPAAVLLMTFYRADWGIRMVGVPLAWAGAAAAGYLPEALTRYYIEGTLVPIGGVEALKPLHLGEMTGILFSTGYRGWISWTPIVVPGLVGLVLLAKRAALPAARWFAWSGLLGMAGILLLDAMHPYGAGAAFGGRRYVSVTPLLTLGLAAFIGPTVGRRLRSAAWVLFPALAAWNLCVLVSYELLIVRHGIYPTLLQAVRHAFGGGIS